MKAIPQIAQRTISRSNLSKSRTNGAYQSKGSNLERLPSRSIFFALQMGQRKNKKGVSRLRKNPRNSAIREVRLRESPVISNSDLRTEGPAIILPQPVSTLYRENE
jgi:hypothetical protein